MSFDPKKDIKISSLDEAERVRAKLIKFVWKSENIPDSQIVPAKEDSWGQLCKATMRGLEKVNKFKIKMKHGVNSYPYLYTPKEKGKGLVIYHHGHGPTNSNQDIGQHTINFLLSKGYHVMGFSMPLSWPNSRPAIDGVNYGTDVEGHNALRRIETKSFCPMRFFIEPVSSALNMLDEKYNFDFYHMVGLSGGGVTTMMCSAIDQRISHGYNIAGGIPIKLRKSKRDSGDYEQIHSEFYGIASYLDLYILGSIGENRKCVQIYNKHDACCFSANPHKNWEEELKKSVNKMNGYYNVYSDSSHKGHIISKWALKTILKEMESQ